MEISSAVKPFVSLFSSEQIQTILLAWLPIKLGPFLSGIMAVDMFAITVIACGISTLGRILFRYFIMRENMNENQITVQIEYYTLGRYNELQKNIIYESLSWLISQKTKNLTVGNFIVNVIPNLNKNTENVKSMFNVIPDNDQDVSIDYNGNQFYVKYKIPKKEADNNNVKTEVVSIIPEKPSIFLTTSKNSILRINDINTLLDDITRVYLENQKINNGRNRYENISSYWSRVQTLSPCQGLDSIALSEENEILLKKELNTFINDKKFYERIGMPYKRGILLYGRPGTGKTSLINAISAHLSRDIYCLNLKLVKDDGDLSALFSSVPANQMIVLEDIDAQTRIIHKRLSKYKIHDDIDLMFDEKKSDQPKSGVFTLSKFLSCLDGHIISEGNLIIMTTNHAEYLDPACIRRGRMDVHLELGYCTHYQIKKLFERVINITNISSNDMDKIPENLIPPCDLMSIMTLYRDDKVNILNNIMDKITELVKNYQNV